MSRLRSGLATLAIAAAAVVAGIYWQQGTCRQLTPLPPRAAEAKQRVHGILPDQLPQAVICQLLDPSLPGYADHCSCYSELRAAMEALGLAPPPPIDELPNMQGQSIQDRWDRACSLYPEGRLSASQLEQAGMSAQAVNLSALSLSLIADNTFLVVILPRGAGWAEDILASLPSSIQLIREVEVNLTPVGARRYVIAAYRSTNDNPHAWTTSEQQIKRHIKERFNRDAPLHACLVQAPDSEELTSWKRHIRKQLGLGTVTIHATDSPREAEELAQLLFTADGIAGLNHEDNSRMSENSTSSY